MVFRLYITRLKCLLRDKSNLFWTILFPIVLATLFSLAFANLYSEEAFQTVNIAVVKNDSYLENTNFKTSLLDARMSNKADGNKLFKVTECDEEEAKGLLDNNDVIGYILLDNNSNIQLVVKDSGLKQTIVKTFLDSYRQTTNTFTSIVTSNPEAIQQVVKDLNNRSSYVSVTSSNTNEPDLTLNYYYSLLAMACLYGCIWGLKEIIVIQGNLSWKGARINVAPVHKMKLLLCNMLAALTIHFVGILILLAYLTFVLRIDFGNDIGYVLLTSFVGCMLGISFGTMVSSISKKSESVKTSIITSLVMFGSFLSGLMMVQMKYIVATKAPIVQYINPAHLITDAFYSLYYYETFQRFYLNITLMIGYSVIFSIITYLATRRRQYANI